MNFRTTSFASSSQALRYSAQYNANIIKYQRQISSGLQLERSSDDPVTFRQVSSLSVRLQELQSESSTIADSEGKLNTSVSQLQQANTLLVRAKSLAQQGIQATSTAERNALAVEVEGILLSLQQTSRTEVAGSFLYSGAKANTEPYQFSGPQVSGGTLSVDYQGSDNNGRAYINDAISVDTFARADRIFSDVDRTEAVILGSTGAKIGQGTDSLVGRATLQVRHTSTSYSGASGVAPGLSSVGGDTVLGPTGEHTLTIEDTSGTGDFGTVSLNGAAAVEWTRSDTDLRVVSNDGKEVFINTSTISVGFNGTIDITSDGTVSVDGGLTTTAIDFSASQTIVDSTTGKQTHIDTRDVRSTGDDYLEFPGTSDVFQVLFELSQDLRGTRDLSDVELAESLDRRVGDLDRLSDHVLEVLGKQAASLQTLNELDNRVIDLQLETETRLSELAATDIPATVLRLQNDQNLLEFTYAVTAQISSTNLLDFLR
jgi:flagellin-like hook-associated protein FlgL